MTTNFKLSELIYSRIAIDNGLLNNPDDKALTALRVLTENLLQPLRHIARAPIHINSGYRCPEVNRLAGGVANSQHILGEAADCYFAEGAALLLQILLESDLVFDQAIHYSKRNFLHLSYRTVNNRRQILLR